MLLYFGGGPTIAPIRYLHDRPGTPLDRAVKALQRYSTPKKHERRREVERNLGRLPDDGFGRVLVAHSVSGHIL